MKRLQKFYEENCEAHNEGNFVLLNTDFEKIEIDTNDRTYDSLRYLQINNLVRFLNPKVNFKKQMLPQISDDDLEMEDLDSALDKIDEMEVSSKKYVYDDLDDMLPLYFLPSHIERKIKDITCGSKRNKIDYRLKSLFSQSIIDNLDLNFKPEQEEIIVDYNSRAHHSVSFFKFYKNKASVEENLEFSEIEKKVNEVKYKLNVNFVESMDYYFIGNTNVEIGLFERDKNEHKDIPSSYHFNLWKLKGKDAANIFSDFSLYPFNKEVLESEFR